jgi:RNA polymerase sigma-70 factor (ECF subfamily)
MFVMGLPSMPTPLPPLASPVDPDTALVLACRRGDGEAFAALIARHRDGVYSFVRHVVGHEADAQDLAQEAFVRAYAALDRFRAGAPFEPWLYTIAANLCRSHLRKARWRPWSLDAFRQADELPASRSADPAHVAEERDQSRRLQAAIQALPAEQRIIVVLHHLRGHTYQEISTIIGLPVSTVEHRLRAARKALRHSLEEPAQPGGTR